MNIENRVVAASGQEDGGTDFQLGNEQAMEMRCAAQRLHSSDTFVSCQESTS